MTVSSKQKQGLENRLRVILKTFANRTNGKHYTDVEYIVNEFIGEITKEVLRLPENYGDLGQLRGYIRRELRSLEKFKDDEENEYQEGLYDAFEEIQAQTKHLMKGRKILRGNRCAFVDVNERYYCGKSIPFGYEHCKDHYAVQKLKEEIT